MITPLSVIPAQFPHFLALFVILHEEHRKRMDQGDRINLSGKDLCAKFHAGDPAACTHLHDIRILICYEADAQQLAAYIAQHKDDPQRILAHLTRNWDRSELEAMQAKEKDIKFHIPYNGQIH